MPHKFSDHILDNGLIALRDATALHFLSRDPLNYADVATYSLGNKSLLLSSLLSISRNSGGYAKKADDTLVWFGNDTLRITDLGLLVEDTRTNLVQQSQTFQTSWTPEASAVTTDQAAAPDGTVTMDKWVEDTTTAVHRIYQQSGVFTSGAIICASIFVKDIDRRYVTLDLGICGAYCVADLQTGTITESGVQGGGNGTLVSASIEPFSNGAYRIIVVGDQAPGTTQDWLIVHLSNTATPGVPNPSYLGTGKGVYLWGAQLEEGSFPSSYIPTTTSYLQRPVDVVTCIGDLNAILSGTAQSTVADVIFPDGKFSNGYYPSILGNSTNKLLFLGNDAYLISTRDRNNHTLSHDFGTLSRYVEGVKVGMASDATGRSVVGRGETVNSDSFADTYPDQILGTSSPFWYYRRLTVWDSRLADTTLQARTDPDDPDVYPLPGAVIDLDFAKGKFFFSDPSTAEDGNGRQVDTVPCIGSGTADGVATDWALVDAVNSRLLANGELDEPAYTNTGQDFNVPALSLRLLSH